MKKFALIAAAAAAALIATPAAAQSGPVGSWYAGAGYTHYDLEDAEVGGVTGRLGYRFHPNFAVEGEATLGTSDDDNAELDNAYGVYGVGILPVTPNIDLFGRVGYQQLSVDGTGPVADIDEDGIGYGAGANFRVSERFGIRGEYTRLDTGEDSDADSFSLGGVVNF
jgi:opacity protein-like surface antigen